MLHKVSCQLEFTLKSRLNKKIFPISFDEGVGIILSYCSILLTDFLWTTTIFWSSRLYNKSFFGNITGLSLIKEITNREFKCDDKVTACHHTKPWHLQYVMLCINPSCCLNKLINQFCSINKLVFSCNKRGQLLFTFSAGSFVKNCTSSGHHQTWIAIKKRGIIAFNQFLDLIRVNTN